MTVTKPPDAFLSYTHFDDQYHGGAIGRFSDRLSMAVRAVTAKPFEIFRDKDGIELGENWRERLNIALGEARFFIPILTPNYFESKACRDELARFLDYEKQSGRNDLILPIYYIDCPVLEDPKLRSDDPLAMEIDGRQHHNWRKLRNKPFGNSAVRTELERLARRIDRARLRAMPPCAASSISGAEPASVVSTGERSTDLGRSTRIPLEDTLALRDQAVISRPETTLPPGTVLRDGPWCLELVVIPPGEFMMGSTEPERRWAVRHGAKREWTEWEKPQHLVKIGYPLAVGRYPVTFDEYDRFADATGRDKPPDENWGRGRRPVINVSWEDAKAYAEWLASITKRPYRLLSEAEWEYACRAGTTTHHSWGDEITPENANYGSNVGRTSEVGDYPANPFGLHDMHGNVWEWVQDDWHDTYHGAPDNGSSWDEVLNPLRVMRGGSWSRDPGGLRSASRGRSQIDRRKFNFGFRVARTLLSRIPQVTAA